MLIIAASVSLLAPTTARSGTSPSPAFVQQALCVHSGWHYASKRPRPGARPEYVLWGHGFWRTWKLPYGPGSEGEGAWSATVGSTYGGGFSFMVGTWNRAAALSRAVPHVSSTSAIAWQPARVQLLAAFLIVRQDGGSWREWPQTSRACGLR